jgi:hypothetical protein
VAGVEADDEARLLLDFLRHRDGRDVVVSMGRSRKWSLEYFASRLLCALRR